MNAYLFVGYLMDPRASQPTNLNKNKKMGQKLGFECTITGQTFKGTMIYLWNGKIPSTTTFQIIVILRKL